MRRISSGSFAFDATVDGRDGRREQITVLYVSSSRLSGNEAGQVLADHFAGVAYPDQIWVLGIADRRDQISELVDDQALNDRVPGFTRYRDTPGLVGLVVDVDGHISSLDGQLIADSAARSVFSHGLVAIFKTHNGMLDAHAGYHYVKPSQRHSDHFLRAANVLLYGSEIEFIAASILARTAGRTIHRIYTDTSSINSLGLSFADLIERLGRGARPSVDSFSSYQGLQSDFIIEPDDRTFALISASTSGGLVNELFEKRQLKPEQQLMIYYVGPPLDASLVLQDLTRGGLSALGFIEPFKSWEPGDCPLCRQNQSTVIIQGDQFLPASPTVTGRMITAPDAPAWLNGFMKDIAGRGIATCRIGFRTFYFHIDAVLNGQAGQLSSDFARAIDRYVPAATRWIIPLDDDDSREIAETLRQSLVANGVDISTDQVVSARELTEGSRPQLTGGVAVVVASVVVSGRSLLNVSRALRSLHDGEPIVYLVAISRTQDEQHSKDLESNLSWGPKGRQFDVHVERHIYVPNEREIEASTWDRERDFLRTLRTWVQSQEETDLAKGWLAAIEERAVELVGPTVEQLFIPGRDERGSAVPLTLQPNFAFWNFSPPVPASQADVFFTMTSVLHSMRGSRRGASLVRDHNWNVLDPRNFSRFNDAVIRASLLRAALPHELDYSTDTSMSHQMQSIIDSALVSTDPGESAAISEFLLAMCMETVRLEKADEGLLVAALESSALRSDLRGALAAWYRTSRAS